MEAKVYGESEDAWERLRRLNHKGRKYCECRTDKKRKSSVDSISTFIAQTFFRCAGLKGTGLELCGVQLSTQGCDLSLVNFTA